jgi:hypothetical protein
MVPLAGYTQLTLSEECAIKVECHQLLEMATAFGVRLPGAALVVILDFTDFGDKGTDWAFFPIIAAESKWTTETAPGSRTPKTPSIYAHALL